MSTVDEHKYAKIILHLCVALVPRCFKTRSKRQKGHLHYVMSLVDMHHENGKSSPNMYATDLV